MHCLRGLFFLFFSLLCIVASAQIPSDLSKVKASQISDQQLQEFLQRAKTSGLTAKDLETELLRRGLPPSEMEELKQRIELLDSGVESESDSSEASSEGRSPAKESTKRKVVPSKTNTLKYESLESIKARTKIFGSELFSNDNLTFEPDLRMATPKNYVVGPDDELILNIYGLNLSQQTLKVSPEGTINVKYAGVVNVNGLTVETATAVLKERLSKFYPALRSGQTKLQLTVGNIRSIRVMLIGAINRPGTYTLPSLATLFNALYVSGGPAENGSFRNIELIRNNKVVQLADLYDFLLKGDQTGNVHLQDNDVIRVPYANLLITLHGELNRPGIFELHPTESLQDALLFAGGFKSKAFRGRITGSRYSDLDRKVIDVSGDSLAFFKPNNGDEFIIDSVINRYQNRVMITGAVFKPGAYALQNGMTLKSLIDKAQGITEDAYTGRALVVRTRQDLTKEYIAIELKPLMAGSENGLVLQKEDSVHVASIFDLRDTITVTINGAVRKPGVYRFEDSLSLKSLIFKAEGFADNATGTDI
jgi:protein involved in polysaccharide export with SLBB domain